MNQQKLLLTISELLSRFVTQIEIDNAMGLLDKNRIAEDVLIPVFSEIYDSPNLVNLNTKGENYEGIDLGDEIKKVAYQITSTTDYEKINETLQSIIDKKYYETFENFYIYDITTKQSTYAKKTKENWVEIVNGKFEFSADNIIDYKDLSAGIRHLSLEKTQKVVEILEKHFNNFTTNSIIERINNHLAKQLTKEKRSRKYIPDIFVEVDAIKEAARFFSHSVLFFEKVFYDTDRLKLPEFNRVLKKLSLENIEFQINTPQLSDINIESILGLSNKVAESLFQLEKELSKYPNYSDRRELDLDNIPANKRYIYNDMKYILKSRNSYVRWAINDLFKDISNLSSQVFFVIGRAGQGKTNFVCDFSENFLINHGIPCLYFTGREFNNVTPENISNYFLKAIFGDSVASIDSLITALNDIAIKTDKPILIIIDGINEHKNIQSFSHHLESLIERFVESPHIKFILTCRSEYFEERFTNFKRSSFLSRTKFVEDLERHMEDIHKDLLIEGYFKFFNISCPYLSHSALELLQNDVLLLRMFCEAYGDMDATETIRIPQLVNIYREKVFKEYLKRKIEEVSKNEVSESGISVGLGDKYRKILKTIIQLMFEKKQFSDIPITELPEDYHEAVGYLLGEDVIVRKDLVNSESVLDERIEVINFTFDEFRDFLLANYLVNNIFPTDKLEFEKIIDEITEPRSPVSEGIRTYLFYASRQTNKKEIHEIIKHKNWYDEIFITSIFSIEEDLITEDDLTEIKKKFYENSYNTSRIIKLLPYRWNQERNPKLNIKLLFEIFNELDEENYNKLVTPNITNYGSDKSLFTNISNELSKLVEDEQFINNPQSHNLYELLIYFFHLYDRDFNQLAFWVFKRFANKKSEDALTILSRHTQSKHLSTQTQVWRMLGSIALDNPIPEKLIKEAGELLSTINENQKSLATELVRFLELFSNTEGVTYDDSIQTLIQKYTLDPFSIYKEPNDTRD